MIKLNSIENRICARQLISRGNNMSLSSELNNVINRLKERVSKEIPDKGFFRNFAENFDKGYKPEFYGKDIALFIERDAERDGRAFLGVSVLHPTVSLTSSTYLMNGDRKKILEFLNDKDFAKELEKTVLELSESLKKS